MCPESLHVYRRIGTSEHERSVGAARRASVDSLQTANVPRVDAAEGLAELQRDIGGRRVARALDVDFEHARRRQPRSPQAAVTQPDEVNIGTGRRVLVPADFWPDFACDENNGRGWEAEVRSTTGLTAMVRFVNARAPDGRPYCDERLALDRLLPL